MNPKGLNYDSDISIQKINSRHLDQVADIYYSYMRGDFIGSCGRYVFLNYMKFLGKSENSSLWCAINTDDRVIGFAASVIDDKYMNRQWILKNLILLLPLVVIFILFSHDFRSFLYRRVRDKFKGSGKISVYGAANYSVRGERFAYLKWILVDKICREAGIASRLLRSIETDVREKGVDQIFSLVERKNTASKILHIKNGWEIIAENEKRLKLAKKV